MAARQRDRLVERPRQPIDPRARPCAGAPGRDRQRGRNGSGGGATDGGPGQDRTGTAHQRSACRCDSTGSRRGGPSVRAGQPNRGRRPSAPRGRGGRASAAARGRGWRGWSSAVPSPASVAARRRFWTAGKIDAAIAPRSQRVPSAHATTITGAECDPAERPFAHVVGHRPFEVGFPPLRPARHATGGPPRRRRWPPGSVGSRTTIHSHGWLLYALGALPAAVSSASSSSSSTSTAVNARSAHAGGPSRHAPPTSGGW